MEVPSLESFNKSVFEVSRAFVRSSITKLHIKFISWCGFENSGFNDDGEDEGVDNIFHGGTDVEDGDGHGFDGNCDEADDIVFDHCDENDCNQNGFGDCDEKDFDGLLCSELICSWASSSTDQLTVLHDERDDD